MFHMIHIVIAPILMKHIQKSSVLMISHALSSQDLPFLERFHQGWCNHTSIALRLFRHLNAMKMQWKNLRRSAGELNGSTPLKVVTVWPPIFLERRAGRHRSTVFVPWFFAGASCETLGVYRITLTSKYIKRWLKSLTKRCHVSWPWHVSKAA